MTRGPVSDYRQAQAGMIVSPLCWKNNEWVGLTLGCSLTEILESLQNIALNADFVTLTAVNGKVWFRIRSNGIKLRFHTYMYLALI